MRICWSISKLLSAADSTSNKCSLLSFCYNMKEEWSRNWQFRSSDLFWGYFFDVVGITWLFSSVILSSWTPVSGWINCYNNWLRSSSCFYNIWFVTSIPLWCCSPQRSFSASVWSDEKISEKCWCNSKDGFWKILGFAVDFVLYFYLDLYLILEMLDHIQYCFQFGCYDHLFHFEMKYLSGNWQFCVGWQVQPKDFCQKGQN